MAILKSIKNQVVVRRRGNKIILSAWPKARSPANKLSPGEKENRRNFKRATLYAKAAMDDPGLKEAYTAARIENQSAFNVAFSDAHEGPQLSKLRKGKYKGRRQEQSLVVQATDNFRVKEVLFSLFSNEGKLMESGEAIRKVNSNDWIYFTRESCSSLRGMKIRVIARDLPGNEALLETVL